MVDGLKLAHLLGRGSFGVVYAGQWYGTDVAVKVIDHDIFSLLGSDGAVKEATMAFQLRHPNVVATLKYVVKSVGAARSEPFSGSCSGYIKDVDSSSRFVSVSEVRGQEHGCCTLRAILQQLLRLLPQMHVYTCIHM